MEVVNFKCSVIKHGNLIGTRNKLFFFECIVYPNLQSQQICFWPLRMSDLDRITKLEQTKKDRHAIDMPDTMWVDFAHAPNLHRFFKGMIDQYMMSNSQDEILVFEKYGLNIDIERDMKFMVINHDQVIEISTPYTDLDTDRFSFIGVKEPVNFKVGMVNQKDIKGLVEKYIEMTKLSAGENFQAILQNIGWDFLGNQDRLMLRNEDIKVPSYQITGPNEVGKSTLQMEGAVICPSIVKSGTSSVPLDPCMNPTKWLDNLAKPRHPWR